MTDIMTARKHSGAAWYRSRGWRIEIRTDIERRIKGAKVSP